MHDYSLAHSRVEVRTATGSSDIFILLSDGLAFEQWDDYRDLHSLGLDSQRSRARSIGLLIDYAQAKGIEFYEREDRSKFFLRFSESLYVGTIRDGRDPSDLWWMPRSLASVKQTLNEVSAFTDWLSKEHGTTPLNPVRSASRAEQFVFWHRWNKRKANSLFKHIKSRGRYEQQAELTEAIRPKFHPGKSLESVKAFPSERFIHLLRDGFTRGHAARWTTLRDQMLAVLMHGGGIRLSECLHMWVSDVFVDPQDETAALVRIYHPSEGIVEYSERAHGKRRRVSRSEYLRTHFDRQPLNHLPTGRRVGWKNPLLTDKDDKYFVVFWRHPDYARLFLKLYRQYIQARPRVTSHPYLFITPTLNPLTVKAYEKVHAAAVRRIGDVPAKHLGTTPHGHRHNFGQALADAGVPEKIIQLALHHSSIHSQIIYKEADATKVLETLKTLRPTTEDSLIQTLI